MLFSIIVPIYDVEAYLPQCIESVLNQSMIDYELILVNDGSPDKCGEICDEYAVLDRRINVIHKKNGGLSDARNAGMTVAKGDYLVFLDSDDYLACSALSDVEAVIRENEWLDVVTCAHINTYPNGDEKLILLPFKPLSQIITLDHLYNEFIRNSSSPWSAGKNVYRKSIIYTNNLKFTVGLIGAEDCDFFMRFIRCSSRFLFLNRPLIHYRQNREGSITSVMSKKAIIGQLKVFYENHRLFANNNQDMQIFFANKFANTISLLFHLSGKADIEETKDYILKHKEILDDTRGLKYIIAKLIWSVFGYHKGSVILQIINSRVRNR